jgi:hypothetical protein
MNMAYNRELWEKILEIGRKQEPERLGIVNHFSRQDINVIIATMEFFGASNVWMYQTHYDLTIPKFRLFDWLAMCVMSRNDDDREGNEPALKVLVHSYLKVGGNPEKFIQDLRQSDYQIDTSWEEITVQ